jgi:hypothetical protein
VSVLNMRKRETTWIIVLLVLGLVYYHFFAGRGPKPIVILAAWHPTVTHGVPDYTMYFTLNDDFKLKTLEVVPLDEDGKVNPSIPPVWNLISDSNSAPVRAFPYGHHIPGMKPALAHVKPDPLTPGVVYRITVSTGAVTGSKDFTARAAQ